MQGLLIRVLLYVHIKNTLVGVMNEQCNSIKMHGINNVRTDKTDSLVPCLHLHPWVLLG
jgi:hypothetical protein